MGFLKDLRDGTHGVRYEPSASIALVADEPTDATFRDTERGVGWHFSLLPLMVDLSSKYDQVLKEDLRVDSVAVFESTFAREIQGRDPSAQPRTVDRAWSPIISVERETFGGAPALLVIHRVTYAPGNELIAGRIVTPLERGTLCISAICKVTMTGMRETVLAALRPGSFEEGLSQSQIDDPALDDQFPTHPLSLVRRALAWIRAVPTRAEVSTPLGQLDDEAMDLPSVGCSIRCPPRFRFSPALASEMSPSLAPFSRATLPEAGSYLFDVWRVPDASIRGLAKGWKLRRLAERTLRGWVKEGATGIEIESWSSPTLDGRLTLCTFTRFRLNSTTIQSVATWLIDRDGAVFRISAGAPLSRSREELNTVVADTVSTWRRLH